MKFVMPDFFAANAEIFLLAMGMIAVLAAAIFKGKARHAVVFTLVQLALIGAFYLTYLHLNTASITTFDGLFVEDKLAVILKLAIYIAGFMSFIYSWTYVKAREMAGAEYYVLALFSIIGAQILVSSASFLTLFLGLELMSLPIYAMVALRRDDQRATEAAMKYFILGAIATGMLLYGMSMIYGASQSLDLTQIASVIAVLPKAQSIIVVFGLVFLLAGIAFKIGAVPFHMWVPDVYTGSPTAVTLFIGSVPKIAGLGLAFRILISALPALHLQWQEILIVIAILSMALGNLVAIAQSNLKRMLAYSSIAHMGYMLLGLIAATDNGYGAALFYMLIYALMTLGAFGMICLMSQHGFEAEEIESYRGLNSRNPWLAFMMLLLMFSLAGIPPLVGFMAKVAVLEALIDVHLVWLAAIAILFAVIGVYYYIRVVKVMYFESPVDDVPVEYGRGIQVAMTVNSLAVLALGIFPGALFLLCQGAF